MPAPGDLILFRIGTDDGDAPILRPAHVVRVAGDGTVSAHVMCDRTIDNVVIPVGFAASLENGHTLVVAGATQGNGLFEWKTA